VSEDAGLTHIDDRGRARMVDVTGKAVTARRAVARCVVLASADAIRSLADAPDTVPFSRAAGIQAAKRTAELVPLCHPLPIDEVDVRIEQAGTEQIDIMATATCVNRTGVEMEALTACGVAGLSMAMALLPVDPGARIDALTLWHKSGGRSGTWRREEGPARQDGEPLGAGQSVRPKA
jgi:cyclic pyranopterin monophosphate synthase